MIRTLVMELGGVILASRLLEYDGLHTCEDKQHYQERLAEELWKIHARTIYRSALLPVFYVTGEWSRGNLVPGYELKDFFTTI